MPSVKFEHLLPTENLDIKAATIPDTHRKDEYEEGTTPERGVIKQEDSRQFSDKAIDFTLH